MTVAPEVVRGAPPRCGGCGYDTTGLASLVCPECGGDLRVVGIVRGRRASGTWLGFVFAALVLLVAWLISGSIVASAVSSLVPARQQLLRDTRLSGPGSRKYQGVDVIGRGTGWVGEKPVMAVRLELLPLPAADGTAPKPPPALLVAPGTGTPAVLQWMARAGLDADDPKVRDEAQAVTMHATRTLRAHGRFATGGYTSSTSFGGPGPGFSQVSGTVRNTTEQPGLQTGVLGAFWVAVYVAGVVFLWRAMRPRRVTGLS